LPFQWLNWGVFLTFDTEMMINREWNEQACDSMKPPSFWDSKDEFLLSVEKYEN
jgi:hypothetical protein